MLAYKTLTELFADPSRWTKRWYYRDSLGMPIDPELFRLDQVMSCCLEGGIRLVYTDRIMDAKTATMDYLKSIGVDLTKYGVGSWNDDLCKGIHQLRAAAKYIDERMKSNA